MANSSHCQLHSRDNLEHGHSLCSHHSTLRIDYWVQPLGQGPIRLAHRAINTRRASGSCFERLSARGLPNTQPILHRSEPLSLYGSDSLVCLSIRQRQVRAVEPVAERDRLQHSAREVRPIRGNSGVTPRVV